MALSDKQFDDIFAHLNNEAEKPENFGKVITEVRELIQLLKQEWDVIIAPGFNMDQGDKREFAGLELQLAEMFLAISRLQAAIDAHPGNPNNRASSR